ncbi:MAG: hypothetical protein AB7J40_01280 [Candidatus Altimarinota bacterium]
MLNEPHYPSKWSVAIVFAVIVLLIGGVFAWAFYFNFGSVHLRSLQNFTVTVNGDTYSCVPECEISLPPGRYDFAANASGFYDKSFELDVSRWQTQEQDVAFELIPFLKPSSLTEIPPMEERSFLRTESGVQVLYLKTAEGERRITDFESLIDPQLQVSDTNAVVVDSGRAFFVDLETGRKIRRFDDTVRVERALLSDRGKRVLFFVKLGDDDLLWIWDHETNQLSTLSWYEPMERIVWRDHEDHRLFVISDHMSDSANTALLDELVQNVDPEKPLGLFSINLDTEEVREITLFEEKLPRKFLRRADRFFVEYEGGTFDELVVRGS